MDLPPNEFLRWDGVGIWQDSHGSVRVRFWFALVLVCSGSGSIPVPIRFFFNGKLSKSNGIKNIKHLFLITCSFLLVGGLWPPGKASQWVPGSPKNVFWKKSFKIHSFVINHHFDHELTPRTYLESEISSRLSDGLPIQSVSLPGCPFMAGQGP